MKLLFIGNSHLAALKTGWAKYPTPRIDPTFIGAQGGLLAHLKRKGSVFTTTNPATIDGMRFTSGGMSSFDCADYDAVILVGMYFGRYRALETMRRHRTIDALGTSPFSQFVSGELRDKVIANSVNRCLSLRVAKWMRAATTKPVLVCEQPMPREAILSKPAVWRDAAVFNSFVDPQWFGLVSEQEAKNGFTVLPQPEQTLAPSRLTLDQYGVGAIRLLDGFEDIHKPTEYLHMNARYGEMVLDQVANCLGA